MRGARGWTGSRRAGGGVVAGLLAAASARTVGARMLAAGHEATRALLGKDERMVAVQASLFTWAGLIVLALVGLGVLIARRRDRTVVASLKGRRAGGFKEITARPPALHPRVATVLHSAALTLAALLWVNVVSRACVLWDLTDREGTDRILVGLVIAVGRAPISALIAAVLMHSGQEIEMTLQVLEWWGCREDSQPLSNVGPGAKRVAGRWRNNHYLCLGVLVLGATPGTHLLVDAAGAAVLSLTLLGRLPSCSLVHAVLTMHGIAVLLDPLVAGLPFLGWAGWLRVEGSVGAASFGVCAAVTCLTASIALLLPVGAWAAQPTAPPMGVPAALAYALHAPTISRMGPSVAAWRQEGRQSKQPGVDGKVPATHNDDARSSRASGLIRSGSGQRCVEPPAPLGPSDIEVGLATEPPPHRRTNTNSSRSLTVSGDASLSKLKEKGLDEPFIECREEDEEVEAMSKEIELAAHHGREVDGSEPPATPPPNGPELAHSLSVHSRASSRGSYPSRSQTVVTHDNPLAGGSPMSSPTPSGTLTPAHSPSKSVGRDSSRLPSLLRRDGSASPAPSPKTPLESARASGSSRLPRPPSAAAQGSAEREIKSIMQEYQSPTRPDTESSSVMWRDNASFHTQDAGSTASGALTQGSMGDNLPWTFRESKMPSFMNPSRWKI